MSGAEKQGVCNSSLVDSTAMGTVAIPTILVRLGLPLKIALERWGRIYNS